jgi:hypothetical protein
MKRGFKFAMMIDDDVLLPADFVIPFEEFGLEGGLRSNVKALAFTIGATESQIISKYGKLNYLAALQGCIHFQIATADTSC